MEDYTSNNKIKENKYKILRMSLLLGSDENREETLNNFEDAACEIDAMNDEIYLKDIEKKFYNTKTLEEEEKKLAVLVDYIGGRVEQRISLLSDFANVTGFDLQALPPIKYYDKLDDYKERLKNIREYLNNTEKLTELNKEVKEETIKLDEAYKTKATFEEYNQKNEDILLSKFQNITKSLNYFQNINEENIDESLEKIIESSEESKKSLDIFNKSYMTLIHSGITKEEEEEYHSYVKNAGEVYYENKEKEYLIKLYKLLIEKETEYNAILTKRDNINNLLYERLNLRKDLEINNNDCLLNIYDLLERQYEDINRQKENIENIERLNELLENKKEEINTLEIENQKVEILALLREFGIIETYSEMPTEESKENIIDSELEEKEPEEKINANDIPKTETNIFDTDLSIQETTQDNIEKDKEDNIFEKNNIFEETKEVEKEEVKDNQVIEVTNATNIDIDLVQSKANKVMQRVGEMLGIKQKEEKIVSVTNEQVPEKVEEVPKDNKENETTEIKVNPLFSETSLNEPKETIISSPEMPKEETVETTGAKEETEEKIDEDFWFPSDTPDALNELPDLEVTPQNENTNNFFTNNMPDLNFPDLKIDFGNNDTEAQ